MSFCGLRNPEKKALRRRQKKGKAVDRSDESQNLVGGYVRDSHEILEDGSERIREILRRKSADFEWAREDQLSAILEVLEERNTPGWEKEESALGWDLAAPPVPPIPSTIAAKKTETKKTRFVEVFTPERPTFIDRERRGSHTSERSERRSLDERRPPARTDRGERAERAQRRSFDLDLPLERTARSDPFADWEKKRPQRQESHSTLGPSPDRSAKNLYAPERARRGSLDRDERKPYYFERATTNIPRRPSPHRAVKHLRPQYSYYSIHNMSDRRELGSPRPIQPPPRDLESISRIDASLVFEHFTTNDAWELGSALRNRLLPIPTPVVISISLANQNQTLFHTCTHTGVMPDNDSWVARKRKTVLRWGVSTWYMHCKFGGDEVAFRQKYGLGEKAGDYAIHGGGVPIRVTGVEGVVAVVVVSGLAQEEDHGVIVEVIRELYY